MNFKTRKVRVGGITYDVPRGIYRKALGWRAQIERVGQPVTRKYFADDSGPGGSLLQATLWLGALPLRDAFRGTPLHRVAHRKLTLTRRTDRDGNSMGRDPSFSIELTPSKSEWARGWMKIFIGSKSTITQERIDEALATLAARLRAYRKESARVGAERAVDSRDYLALEPRIRCPYRLEVSDVLAWNGRSRCVTFTPKPQV